MIKKLLVLFTVSILIALTVSLSYSAESIETKEVTETSEVKLTIDVTDRYTDSSPKDDNSKSEQGKAVFIGIMCLLLLIGIVIIAVKSRDSEPPASQTDSNETFNK